MVSTAKRDGLILATVLIATSIGQFDFFVVNVAAPDIQNRLGASNTQLELVVAGYAFMYASGLVTGGRLGDLLGRRRMFVSGLTAFAVTSALCGLAPSAMTLIAFRALQGLSAAVMLPQVLAFINTLIPVQRRGWAMGWFGVASGLGSIAGQGLGGLLVQADLWGLGWRLIFLMNIPIMLLAIIATLRIVPQVPGTVSGKNAPGGSAPLDGGTSAADGTSGTESAARAQHAARTHTGVDIAGAFALFMGMGGLMSAALVIQHGLFSVGGAAAAAGVVIVVLALRYQRRRVVLGRTVMLDPALFQVRSMRWGSIASAAFMAYFASFMFVLTVILQHHIGLGPSVAGLVFVPSGVTFMVSSLTGSRWIGRHLRAGLLLGCAITASGLAIVLFAALVKMPAAGLAWALVAAVSLTGFGNGLVLPTLTGLSLSQVLPAQAGMASGVVTTVQQFGASLGVTAVGALFYSGGTHSLTDGLAASAAVHLLLLTLVALACAVATRASPGAAPR